MSIVEPFFCKDVDPSDQVAQWATICVGCAAWVTPEGKVPVKANKAHDCICRLRCPCTRCAMMVDGLSREEATNIMPSQERIDYPKNIIELTHAILRLQLKRDREQGK